MWAFDLNVRREILYGRDQYNLLGRLKEYTRKNCSVLYNYGTRAKVIRTHILSVG